jgi:hypothetical protein
MVARGCRSPSRMPLRGSLCSALANVRLVGGELGDRGSHGFDLTLESVDGVGAVASVDQQQFVAW